MDTTVVTLRLPTDLVEWVDGRGKRAAVVTEALEGLRTPKRFALTEDNLMLIRAAVQECFGAVTQRVEASGPARAEDAPHNTDVVAGSSPARPAKFENELVPNIRSNNHHMQALREICAGKIGGHGETENYSSQGTNVAMVRSQRALEDGGCGSSSEINEDVQDEISGVQIQVRLCVSCDEPLRSIRGKWACTDVSCGMAGQEQKGKPSA